MAAGITIPSIFIAKDKFTGVVKKMTMSVKKFGKTGVAAMQRFDKKVNSSFDKLGRVGKLVVGAGLIAGLNASVQASMRFEKAMSNVATLVDTNVEDIGKMGDEVMKLSQKIPKPVEELTESLYSIRSAGISAEDAMGALENAGKLSVSGLSTTAEATDILTSAMNAFASEGLSTEEISNILFKTVKAGKTDISKLAQAFGANAGIIQSAGVKLADFQAATAALTTTGTPAAQVQNQLRSAIVKLKKPTAEMTQIFKALGVSSDKDLIQKFGTLGGAFEAIDSKAGQMGINMAKAWGSSEALAASTSLLGAQSSAYVSTLADMQSGTNEIDKAFKKQSDTAASQAQLAKNNMEALSITFGNLLVPIMNKAIETFVPLIQKITTFIKKNKWVIKVLVGVVGGFFLLKAALIGAKIATTAYSIAMGISAARTGAMSIAMKGNVIAQGAFKAAMFAGVIATKVMTAAQWLLNVALNANPIGLIIIGIVALIAVVALIIKYYDDWGAALSMLLGPFGLIISIIQSFRRNWEMVKEAFAEGGLLEGLKAIGRVLLDAVLMPIQQLLGLLAKIPGLGGLAGKGADFIAEMRANLGVETGENSESSDGVLPSTAQATNSEVIQRSESKNSLQIDVRDKGNNIEKISQSGNDEIGINTSSTIGAS